MSQDKNQPSAGETGVLRGEDGRAALAELDRLLEAEGLQASGRLDEIGDQPRGLPAEQPVEVFRSLPRRAVQGEQPERRPKRMRRPRPPKPPLSAVLLGMLGWTRAIARFYGLILWDGLRGQGGVEQKARRMRTSLESLGPMGVKIGKQLAMRIDMMPLEYSMELSSMRDVQPPMEFREAMKRVREAIGEPVEQVFEVFDPVAIASTSVTTVYQGKLRGGAMVAVRVRKPGVRSAILANLQAVSTFTRTQELLTLHRPGFYIQLRNELMKLANEELDLTVQGRYQTLFRSRSERDGLKWLTAPKVYEEISNHAVLISELVAGVRCSEVLDAVERDDKPALAALRQRGINPRKVGRRLLRVGWWSMFENLFFVAQADPQDIVVQPGNKLVFTDFEGCGMLAAPNKRQYRRVLRDLSKDDVAGAANGLVQLLSPLPFIDVSDFSKRIEAGLWHELFAMRDLESIWWERTTIGLWRNVLSACRKHGVTPRLEVLRLMRATLTYDTLAARLRPGMDPLKEFDLYVLEANRRAARRVRKELERTEPEDLQATAVARMARVAEGMGRMGLWLETTVENLPISNLALSGKASYAVSQVLRLSSWLLGVLTLSTAAVMLSGVLGGQEARVVAAALIVVNSALFRVVALALVALTLRRVLFRLDDKGTD